MVDHQDRMDLWMETPPGVGGSWDRRGTPACPLSPSPARGLMIPTPTANLWHSGWPITNKPCWWKSCKCSAIVWYIHITCEDILRIESPVIPRINILSNYIGFENKYENKLTFYSLIISVYLIQALNSTIRLYIFFKLTSCIFFL